MSLLTRLMQFTSNEHSPDTFGNKPTDRRRYGTGLMSGDKLSDTINPRRISDLPIEFRSSGRGFTQDLRAKNQCTTGDTNGSSLRWDISRHGSDPPPDFAPLLTGLQISRRF